MSITLPKYLWIQGKGSKNQVLLICIKVGNTWQNIHVGTYTSQFLSSIMAMISNFLKMLLVIVAQIYAFSRMKTMPSTGWVVCSHNTESPSLTCLRYSGSPAFRKSANSSRLFSGFAIGMVLSTPAIVTDGLSICI